MACDTKVSPAFSSADKTRSRSDVSLLSSEPSARLSKLSNHRAKSSLSSQPSASLRPAAKGLSQSGPTHIISGSRLYSNRHVSYVVHSILWEGTFKKVAKCTRKDTNSMVAVKIIRSDPEFIKQAKKEVAILNTLKRLAPSAAILVQLNNCFFDRGNFCMEFPLLDMDLFDFMKRRAFRPLRLRDIRIIVQQLASALQQLKTIGIIHGDLKLENVMIVDLQRQSAKVKIIDFGLACHVSAAKPCATIQSREYRCPEVMLGLPFSVPADMWSLGCIAAFLFLGSFLYFGKCEYEMMRHIVETQGYPPDHLLKAGMKTGKFFYRTSSCANRGFRLKTTAEYCAETGFHPMRNRRFNSLNDLQQFKHPMYHTAELEDTEGCEMFVYMLKAMLELEASRRISPRQVLQLPFFKHRKSDRNRVCLHHRIFHHVTVGSCKSNQNQCEAREETKRTRVEDETDNDDDKKRVKADVSEDGQRNHTAGVLTSATQTNQTPPSRPRASPTTKENIAKAEPQSPRRARPKAPHDQSRRLSPRTQLWYSQFQLYPGIKGLNSPNSFHHAARSKSQAPLPRRPLRGKASICKTTLHTNGIQTDQGTDRSVSPPADGVTEQTVPHEPTISMPEVLKASPNKVDPAEECADPVIPPSPSSTAS